MEPTKENLDAKELCQYIENTERFYDGKIKLFDYYAAKTLISKNETTQAFMDKNRLGTFKTLCLNAAKDYTEKILNIEVAKQYSQSVFSKETRHEAARILEKQYLEYFQDKLMEHQV